MYLVGGSEGSLLFNTSSQITLPLPMVVIGKRDISMEAHSVQDLEALPDAVLLWDVRDKATAEESARRASL